MHSDQLDKSLPWALPKLPQGFYDSPILLIQLSLILILKSNLFWLLVVVDLPQQNDSICGVIRLKISHAFCMLLHFWAFRILNPIYVVQ